MPNLQWYLVRLEKNEKKCSEPFRVTGVPSYKEDMIGNHLLQTLLASTALAKKLMPGLDAEVQAFMTAFDVAEEKEAGRLTQRAKDMRQRLRNPYFETTHKAKARSIAKKNRAKAAKDVGPKIAQALEAIVLCLQTEQVVADLEGEEEADLPSRKQELTFEHAALQAFADEMSDRQVPPHQLGLLSKDHLEVIAKIVRYSINDPGSEDPLNPLFVLARHGDLHAMRESMTSDEAWMMAEVEEERLKPAWLERREQLEARVGRPLQILPSFAASMERFASAAESMSEGESERFWVARGRAFKEQAEILAAILGHTVDVRKCASLLSILQDGISWTDEHYSISLTFRTLEGIVRDLELREVPPEDWIPLLWRDLCELDDKVASKLSRPEQFHAILSHVIASSHEMKRYHSERTQSCVYDTALAPSPNYRWATEDALDQLPEVEPAAVVDAATDTSERVPHGGSQSRALVLISDSDSQQAESQPENQPLGQPPNITPPTRRSSRRYTQEDLA